MADFINPGDAAGQALQGFLVQQQQQKQQALINSMAQSRLGIEQAREGRLSQLEQLQIQEGRATQARLAQEEVEKEADKVAKNMQPGDIPDAQAAATLQKAGQGFLLHPGPSQTSTIPAADPTMPAPGQGVDPATGAPVTTPAPALPGALPAQTTTLPGALRFQGLPAQRDELRKQGARQHIANAIRMGADPKEIIASAYDQGLPPAEVVSAITALKPKTPTAEIGLVAKGSDGKVIPGVVALSDGVPMLNGQPLPTGATVERAPAPRDPVLEALARAETERALREPAGSGGTPIVQVGADGQLTTVGTVPKGSHIINAPAQAVNRTDMAKKVGSHFDDLRSEIDEADKRGLLGPLAGRTMSEFLAGGVGSTGNDANDQLLDALRTDLTLVSSGVASLHGRQGANQGIARDIKTMLDSNKMSHAGLIGSLGALQKWTDTYAGKAPSTETPAARASRLLKEAGLGQ